LRHRGYDRTRALLEAGPTRLRPILMTTLSVMAALLPITTGLEEGSELLKSAAVGLTGGLLTSTLLTLVFVPAMYTVFDDIQAFVMRLLGHEVHQGPERPEGISGAGPQLPSRGPGELADPLRPRIPDGTGLTASATPGPAIRGA